MVVPAFTNDNESAFPFGHASEGMTMREWYAGQAMLGILAGGLSIKANPPLKPAEVAEGAFNLADAMLARAKKPQ